MATSKIPENPGRPIVAGETAVTGGSFTGYISGGAKSINIGLKFARIIKGGSTAHATVTALVGALRGVNGYLAGATNDTDILALSSVSSVISNVDASQSGGVSVIINFTNALDVANNTPVTFSGYAALTFS